MTAKEYLKQGQRLNELIKSDREELCRLKALVTDISAKAALSERVQTSRVTNDKTADTVARIVDLQTKIQDEIDSYINVQSNIRGKIMMIEDVEQRLVLKHRYISFMRFCDIADDMNFTEQWIYVLHKRALKSFEKLLKN